MSESNLSARLDIIVTHYKEPIEVVKRFLDSLCKQTYKSLKVTIIDDGFDCPDLSSLLDKQSFGFQLRLLKKDHKTVSASRNYGLDHTDCQYLMFCDCDDAFDESNPNGLLHAMQRVEADRLCVYRSPIKAEVWKKKLSYQLSALAQADENDEIVTVKGSTINQSTVHCKIYERKFILENNIRFLDDLSMNEDSVFNIVAYKICEMNHLPMFDDHEYFYIWKYNENSVTRENKLYPLDGLDQFLIAISHIYKLQLGRSNKPCFDNDHYGIAITIFQTYYWLHLYSDRFKNDPEYDILMDQDLKEFSKFYRAFNSQEVEKQYQTTKMKNYMDDFMRRLDKCDLSEKLSFEDWLKRVII